MPKPKLDVRDRKLLYELDVNGRSSYSELAKKIGISKQLTKYKVERLEKEGLIKGYYTLIDISKLGYTTIRVYVKFRNINLEAKKEMIASIQNQDAIFAVALLSGKWDFAFLFNLKDVYDFYAYWDDILNKYLENILDYQINIFSPVYHFSKAYLIKSKDTSSIRILGGRSKEDLDSVELSLLRLLSENARASLVELGKKLEKSPEAVSYRIKQLEKKGVIQGYRALIDINLLNREFYKVDLRLRSMKNFKKLLAYCHLEPNIYQINRTIGGQTLEIEFQVRSLNHLHKELEQLEKKFPDTIEYYDYYVIFKELKVTYMPKN